MYRWTVGILQSSKILVDVKELCVPYFRQSGINFNILVNAIDLVTGFVKRFEKSELISVSVTILALKQISRISLLGKACWKSEEKFMQT